MKNMPPLPGAVRNPENNLERTILCDIMAARREEHHDFGRIERRIFRV
jgi:hypothetical protein